MKNVSDQRCRVNENTHIVFSNFFFENRAFYYIRWGKNILETGRTQMTSWRMRIACWLTKTTHTHTHTHTHAHTHTHTQNILYIYI